MRLDLRPVDLPAVVEAAVESIRPAAYAKQLSLDASIAGPLAPVTGDRERLQQVVWNLVSNAVTFTPNGGRIHVDVRRVEARLVRHVVELHGGTVTAASPGPGRGATVVVTLPIAA